MCRKQKAGRRGFIFAAVRYLLEYLRWRQKAGRRPNVRDERIRKFIYQDLPAPLPQDIQTIIKTALQQYARRTREFPAAVDFGAGSRWALGRRSLASIARKTAIPERRGRILYNTVRWIQPSRILELGTGLGISALYMALAAPNARILTLEGHPDLASWAQKTFDSLGIRNVEVVQASFEEGLPDALDDLGGVDFAWIDGDHQYQPTIRNTDVILSKSKPPTVLGFDDIRWSGEMTAAWYQVCSNPYLRLNMDFFNMGLCFCINYPIHETLCLRM